MIRIAVCDDDFEYLQDFKEIISASIKMSGINATVSFFTNGNKLLEDFENHKLYDIVLLDIDMPNIDGKELAQKLRILNSRFFLVFITSYKAEVYNTIPYRINSFISKDKENNFFISELSRVFKEYLNFNPEYEIFHILSRKGKETVRILLNDIFYIYCSRRTTYLVTGKNEEIKLDIERFSDIVNEFCNKGFFELSRGYIANISKIKSIRTSTVILDNDIDLPLSRGRKKLLLEQISNYITEEANNYANSDSKCMSGNN